MMSKATLINKTTLANIRQAQKGVGLVEILVTILITVIGLVGLASMQLKSVRANQNANQKAQAIWMVSDMANRIRANSRADYTGSFNCSSPLDNPNESCSAHYRGGSLQGVNTSCTANELAAFDKLDVLCGFNQTNNGLVYEGAGAFLANPQMNIQTTGSNTTITLSWSVRQNESSNSSTEQVQMVIYK